MTRSGLHVLWQIFLREIHLFWVHLRGRELLALYICKVERYQVSPQIFDSWLDAVMIQLH
jgi:hypothetical protein